MESNITESKGDTADVSILDSIDKVIGEMGFESEKTPDGLFVDSGLEVTLVSVEDVKMETSDGPAINKQVARVITKLVPHETFYPRELLKLNALAALGAAIQDDDGILNLATRLSINEESEDDRDLSVQMAASASIFNVYSFFGEDLDLEFSGSESIWSEADFSTAARTLKEAAFVVSNSPTGMSLEITIDPNALPNAPNPHTSLLTFDTNEAHPNLGSGLLYKLELPIRYSEGQLIELSIKMNEDDFAAPDAPPMIGAWTGILERNSLVYTGFWPNSMYRPGVVSKISGWMIRRNELACALIYGE